MARVTVEDCIEKIPNRFQLVMFASQRARNLSSGAELTVEKDDDKNPVIALREIAEETIDVNEIEEILVKGLQKHLEPDVPDEEEMDQITAGDEFITMASDLKANLVLGGTGEMPAFTDNIIERDDGEAGAADDVGNGVDNSDDENA